MRDREPNPPNSAWGTIHWNCQQKGTKTDLKFCRNPPDHRRLTTYLHRASSREPSGTLRNPPEPHQVSAPETSGYMHQNPLEPHQVSAPLEPSRTVEPPQVSSQEPFTGTSGAIWTGTFETCTVTLWNLVRNLVLKRNQIACASRSRKMAWIFLTHFNLTNQSPRHAPQVGFQKHHSQRQKKCRRRSRLRTMKQCPNLPTSSNAHQRCSF